MNNILVVIKYISNFVNNLLIRYPLPKNLGYMWNYGFLSGIALAIQIVTGLFLAMFYTPHIDYAFTSVDHIMHDVMYGWVIRLLHLNTASFFFFFIYVHMLRGIYYKSYHAPKSNTWFTGVTIYLLLMAAAFLGHVLPWGQMSFWAATVITNLFTVVPLIGKDLVVWIWGGYSINNATLNRFFCIHYLLPLVILVLVILHVLMLHSNGSTNELGIKNGINSNIKFYPFYILKDLLTVCLYLILLILILFFNPEILNHAINYIASNPLVTPTHIVPEWYFLPSYAILRCISNKEIGIIYMAFSIIILFILPKIDLSKEKITIHKTRYKQYFWIFFSNVTFLGYMGMETINNVSIYFALISTGIHWIYLLTPYINVNTYIWLFNTINYLLIKEEVRTNNKNIKKKINE